MSSDERKALETLAQDWLDRAKMREPSVRAIWETCAEQLLARLPKGKK